MRFACIALLFVLSTFRPCEAGANAKLKNVVFVLVDDLGWADLGCYGSKFHETPNLDKFAASGVRFTDAYAACPVCSPTRAAIMTGQHPVRVGITDWIPGQSPKDRRFFSNEDLDQLPLKQITLAEGLKEHGYKTFFAGKWHLGSDGFFPEDQGFDINKGGHHKGSPPGGYYDPYRNPKLGNRKPGEYLPDRLTDESISFLKSVGDESFLLYLSFYTVHTPIQADKQSVDRFKAKVSGLGKAPAAKRERKGYTRQRQDRPDYASMVYGMDRNVGRLLDTLEDLGLDKNTAVFFTSDNGGLSTLGRRNSPTSNLPLRAGKGWCYEGGIRVPLIVRAPGVTQAGGVSSEPVTSMDYFPTILRLLDLPAMAKQHVDGFDLTPLLAGTGGLDRKALHWHYPHYHGSTWAPGAAIRAGDWKLIEFYDSDEVELFNLKTDPGEQANLVDTNPGKQAELKALLRAWQSKVGAKMPRANPAFVGSRE